MVTSTNVTEMLSPDPKNGQHRQQGKEQEVQVDLSNMIGRIKPKPVCVDETLKKQAMCCEEISKFVFETDAPKDAGSQEISVVSSGSSTASRENGLSDTTSEKSVQSNTKEASTVINGSFLHRKTESERINLKVKTQTISRNGRQTQRWYTCPATHTLYRMTTGCIPVLKDGKVLFCSASRKPEWILPKGGWEKDEAMEESAIRETFEEAGVFGIIGPCLSEIEFETRKGKKRRIEFEEVQRKAKQRREAQSSSPKGVPQTDEEMAPPSLKNRVVSSGPSDEGKKLTEATIQSLSSQDPQPSKLGHHSSDGDCVSVASETSLSHAHVKMSLFPLYVTEVKETWPEQGRFRKVVDIDEAIKISESRPYFQQALQELKERNLHISPELQSNGTVASQATEKER